MTEVGAQYTIMRQAIEMAAIDLVGEAREFCRTRLHEEAREHDLMLDPEREIVELCYRAKFHSYTDPETGEDMADLVFLPDEAEDWEALVYRWVANAVQRRCRVCGCTTDNACNVDSVLCHWVDYDLCSRCRAEVAS